MKSLVAAKRHQYDELFSFSCLPVRLTRWWTVLGRTTWKLDGRLLCKTTLLEPELPFVQTRAYELRLDDQQSDSELWTSHFCSTWLKVRMHIL